MPEARPKSQTCVARLPTAAKSDSDAVARRSLAASRIRWRRATIPLPLSVRRRALGRRGLARRAPLVSGPGRARSGRRKTNGGRGRRSLRPSDSWRPFGRSARDRVGLAPPSRPRLPRNATEASRRPGVPLRQRVWGSLAGKRGGRKDEAVHGDATARSRAWFPEWDPLVPSSEDRHAPIVALATGPRAGEIPSAKAASMLRLIDRRDLSSGGGTRVRGRWAARGRSDPRP